MNAEGLSEVQEEMRSKENVKYQGEIPNRNYLILSLYILYMFYIFEYIFKLFIYIYMYLYIYIS